MNIKLFYILLIPGVLVLGACAGNGGWRFPDSDSGRGMPMDAENEGPSMMEPGGGSMPGGSGAPSGTAAGDVDRSTANGERIYFTATNQEGDRIPYAGGPKFGGMMMGTYLTCASCHGPEARGGKHVMHMQIMDAPDIRYESLSGEAEEEHGHEEDEQHADEHAGFDLQTFRKAVVHGQHPDGEPLNRNMPRWKISDTDLADLFAFLKTIP